MEPKIRFSSSNILYEEKTLSEISTINPKTNVPLEFEYVDLESVSGTEMTNHRTEHKATAPSRAQRLAKKGDIFYQTVRPYQKNNYYFDMDDDNYVFSTGYAQIRPSIYGKYLFTLLQNDSFLKQVLDNCAGTSFPAINPSVLSRLSVRICTDKQEQQAIGKYFTSLDSQISASTSRLASLKQMKAASLQAMFPQEGETVPKIRFKGFEGEWKKVKLSEILTERHENSTITDSLPQLSFTIADGVIRPEDRKSNKRDFLIKDIDNKRYLVTKVGDIIYNPANVVYGAIHRNSLMNGVVSPIYKIFTTMQDSNFIECAVRRPSFITKLAMCTEGTVTKLKTLKPEAFLNMEVCITPSLEEQKLIGNYFTSLDRQISLQSQRLEKLKQIKSACLDKMFV